MAFQILSRVVTVVAAQAELPNTYHPDNWIVFSLSVSRAPKEVVNCYHVVIL